MALVNCPECGKENVNDQAEMCPNCGFGIKAYFDKIRQEEQRQIELDKERQNRLQSIPRPEEPKVSRAFVISMAVIFIVLTWLFLYSPKIYGEEGKVGAWLFEIFIFVGLPIYIYVRQYQDRVEKYNLSIQDINMYKDLIIKEQDEAKDRQRAIEERKIKCPNCGSTNTARISTLNRAVSVATAGLASSKIGKTMQCRKCGYKW